MTTSDDARAFARVLRAAGATALADQVAGALTAKRSAPILLTRAEGAESALAVLDESVDEAWHSATFDALRSSLHAYLDE